MDAWTSGAGQHDRPGRLRNATGGLDRHGDGDAAFERDVDLAAEPRRAVAENVEDADRDRSAFDDHPELIGPPGRQCRKLIDDQQQATLRGIDEGAGARVSRRFGA